MNTLSNKQSKHLKGLAHSLKPVVMIGDKGLTQAVLDEMASALEVHELIKVKIRGEDKEQRQKMIDTMTRKTGSLLVQRVGHTVSIFKRIAEAKIALPK